MSKIIIQIDDSDVAIKRLSSILDMKICTPLYRRRVHDFTKCSGTFEIRIGDFVCYFPQMMTKLNKRLLIAKIEGISTKEPSLDKKKQSLKDVSIDCCSYAIQDRMQDYLMTEFVKMDIMDEKELNYAMQVALDNGLTTAAAYILNSLNKKKKTKLKI